MNAESNAPMARALRAVELLKRGFMDREPLARFRLLRHTALFLLADLPRLHRMDADERDARFRLLMDTAAVLLPDFMLTWPAMTWMYDEKFRAYLRRFDEHEGANAHRRWMVGQLLRLVRDVSGDTVECGAYLGATSWLIAANNGGTSKVHHVFDSFEGLSAPDARDGAHWSAGDLAATEERCRANLAPFGDAVRLYRGWIPARFPEVADRRFSFVHVDVDLHQPTLDSIEFFYPRLSEGGILVCDDYACDTCPGATEAVDTFLAQRDEKMLALPDGGGMFIKGIHTGELRLA